MKCQDFIVDPEAGKNLPKLTQLSRNNKGKKARYAATFDALTAHWNSVDPLHTSIPRYPLFGQHCGAQIVCCMTSELADMEEAFWRHARKRL
eukprot:934464-Amphidinium_carterae.1